MVLLYMPLNKKIKKTITMISLLFTAVFLMSEVGYAKMTVPADIQFKKVDMFVGKKKISVELALTPEQQERGLMFRKSLNKDEGMLFVFPVEETLSFWMKNTIIDLSIAYIDATKKIIDIQEMKATKLNDTKEPKTYPSKKPAQFALEMSKGWFKKHNIKVGDLVKIP